MQITIASSWHQSYLIFLQEAVSCINSRVADFGLAHASKDGSICFELVIWILSMSSPKSLQRKVMYIVTEWAVISCKLLYQTYWLVLSLPVCFPASVEIAAFTAYLEIKESFCLRVSLTHDLGVK
ncbi:hypothetical protein K7X08_036900 [Anisodus acutangulus]|uniref:Uncharacterized protein n=1 Tax=Anisodus acutangulus TaxID=402998 RepID=A0A9Q1QVA3_9SOLA|nr:hypothetical protein K7X08_036900 [Anisodus acutangulus]